MVKPASAISSEAQRYYVRERYGLDPVALERDDPALWMTLFEILPGELMAATYAEWRASEHCRGAVIWNWQDLWPVQLASVCATPLVGAKAALHYLRRALSPHAVFLIDEGLNGLDIHLINELDSAQRGGARSSKPSMRWCAERSSCSAATRACARTRIVVGG